MFPILFEAVKTPFNPRKLYGLSNWYDASNVGSLTPYDAIQLTSASSQYLEGTSLGTASLYNSSFSLCGWFSLDADSDMVLFFDGDSAGGLSGDYAAELRYLTSSKKLQLRLNFYDAANTVTVLSQAITTGTYYHAAVTYSSGSVTLYVNTVPATGVYTDSMAHNPTVSPVFRLGATAGPSTYMGGKLDEWGFWTKALTSGEVSSLYGGGSGLEYPDWTGSLLTSLSSVWRLREVTGTRYDSVGTVNLAASGGPTVALGIPASYASSGDVVSEWRDLSGNSRHLTQTTPSKAAVYLTNALNGRGAIKFDRVDDYFDITSAATVASGTVFAVVNMIEAAASNQSLFSGATGAFGLGWNGATPPVPRLLKQNTSTVFNATVGTAAGSGGILTVSYGYGTGTGVCRWNRSSIVGAVSDPAATFSQTTKYVGCDSSTPASFFGGRLHELVVYNRVLSSVEIARVESYLQAKWGTP